MALGVSFVVESVGSEKPGQLILLVLEVEKTLCLLPGAFIPYSLAVS